MKITQNPLPVIAVLLAALLAALPAQARVISSNSFEDPVVSGRTLNTPVGWKRADPYGGNKEGMENENSGGFTTPYGAQAAAMSGGTDRSTLTSTESNFDDALSLGVTYTVSFNVAKSTGLTGYYNVQLMAYTPGHARYSQYDTTVLASRTGTATTNDMSETVTFTYQNNDPASPLIGRVLGVRLRGGASLVDNLVVADDNASGLDIYPPALWDRYPRENATTMMVDYPLLLTFNEDVAKGSGNLVVYKASDDSVFETIDVTSGQVAIAGRIVTVTLSQNLAPATTYYVTIDDTAFTDLASNNYQGINLTTNPTNLKNAWQFSTPIADGPHLIYETSFESPAVTGQATVDPQGWLISTGYGTGSAGLVNTDSGLFTTPYGAQAASRWASTRSLINTAEATIDAVLVAGVTYTLSFNVAGGPYRVDLMAFNAGVERRVSTDNQNNGTVLVSRTGTATTNDMAAQREAFTFTADVANASIGKQLGIRIWYGYVDNVKLTDDTDGSDVAPPALWYRYPRENATTMTVDYPLLLTFSEDVVKGSGNIVVYKASDDSMVDTIDVASGQVAIDAIDSTMVTVTLSQNLAPATTYYVTMDNGIFADLASNDYPGINLTTNPTTLKTAWRFSTPIADGNTVIYQTSFESPVVTGQAQTAPTGWVLPPPGWYGTGSMGLANTDSGLFTTPYGEQAAAKWAGTRSHLNTDEPTIEHVLVADVPYTVSFNVARGSYMVELLAFDPGVARRWSGNNDPTLGTVLASRTGSAVLNDMAAQRDVFTFTAAASNAHLGKLLGIRIQYGYIDNLKLTWDPPLPDGPDPDISTVVASPVSVPADGLSTSTVTVTLKTADGTPVPDRQVALANTAGPGMADIAPAGPVTSDENGVATFTVSSATVGSEVFTATDITDDDNNIAIAQAASVAFTIVSQTSLIAGYTPPPPPPPNAPQTSLAGTTNPPSPDNQTAAQDTSEATEPVVEATPGVIRVTEYYLTPGDFGGTATTVVLNQDLAADHFILVRGSRTGNGLSMPDSDYARVAAVPGGRGGLTDSGAADLIGLRRAAAEFDWEGVVTVVECIAPDSPSGFRLIDAVVANLSGAAGTLTCAPWGDASRVVPFGGYRGGGVELTGGVANRYQGTSAYVRLAPGPANTLDWQRDGGGETLADATMTTFVVEWGAGWTVQHASVAGSSGGDGVDAPEEYTTAAIAPVARANTWVWGTGIRADAGIGDCAESCVVTLGDGAKLNATETTVAVGSEYTDAYSFDVYALTHPALAVDHRFKPDGDLNGLDIPVAVAPAAPGARFAWLYNGCNGTSSRFPRPRMWSRYTAGDTVTVSRGYDGAQFPAWIQGIDFSGLED